MKPAVISVVPETPLSAKVKLLSFFAKVTFVLLRLDSVKVTVLPLSSTVIPVVVLTSLSVKRSSLPLAAVYSTLVLALSRS